MAISLETKTAYAVNTINFTAKNAVECKLNLTEEEAGAIICSNARAYIESAECVENEVRYTGRVIFSLITGASGLKKSEAGVEFSYKADVNGVSLGDAVSVRVAVENQKVTVINGIPTASAAVVVIGEVEKPCKFDYVKNVEGANCKKEEFLSANFVALEKKDFSLEEEFDTDIIIEDVIYHNQNVKILSATCSIGAIILSGEVELNALILKEDKTTFFESRVIPFRFEHEVQKCMPDSVCVCNACLKDVNLKIVVDKAKGKSTVFMSANVNLCSALYENEILSKTVDAYSLTNHVTIEKQSQKLVKKFGQRQVEFKCNTFSVAKNDKNALLVSPLFAKIEQIDVTCKKGELNIQGVVNVSALMQTEAGYSVESYVVPIERCEPTTSNAVVLSSACVSGLTVVEKDGAICFDFNISLFIEEKEEVYSQFIKSLEEGEAKKVNTSAISVCIPKPNDTLWELSKSLGVLEEDLLKLNPELKFPLTGEERVVVYRELKTN